MEDMISCRNLTRRFGEFTAVNGLNLEVAAGAICAFLGPNGAGKSTTVKMMTGLLAPIKRGNGVWADAAANPLELKRRIQCCRRSRIVHDLTVEGTCC
jgi:ABC-2 type transport system ATP-binding protein